MYTTEANTVPTEFGSCDIENAFFTVDCKKHSYDTLMALCYDIFAVSLTICYQRKKRGSFTESAAECTIGI